MLALRAGHAGDNLDWRWCCDRVYSLGDRIHAVAIHSAVAASTAAMLWLNQRKKVSL